MLAKGTITKFCITSLGTITIVNIKYTPTRIIPKGFTSTCREFKIHLLGGDTNQGTEISIHVVLFGSAKNYMRRKGSRIRDIDMYYRTIWIEQQQH